MEKGFISKQKDAAMERFIGDSVNEFEPKSYYHRAKDWFQGLKIVVWILSSISIFTGLTACIVFFMMLLGINDTLLGFITGTPTMAALVVFVSGVILYYIEYGKHNRYSDGLTEAKRNTDDNGRGEIRFAFFLQLLSVCMCMYGAYTISNEVAGTKSATQLDGINAKYAAVVADYNKEIQFSDSAQTTFKAIKLYRNKLSDVNTNEFNRLGDVTQKWKDEKDASIKQRDAEIEQQGLKDFEFNPYDAVATKWSIIVMCGIQVFIEIALFYCLHWIVSFRYRVAIERGLSLVSAIVTPTLPTQSIPASAPHKSVSASVPVVPQQTQPQTAANTKLSVFDYSNTKSNLKTYIKRLLNTYTSSVESGVKRYATQLAAAGFKVEYLDDVLTVDDKNSPSLPLNSTIEFEFDGDKLIIKSLSA